MRKYLRLTIRSKGEYGDFLLSDTDEVHSKDGMTSVLNNGTSYISFELKEEVESIHLLDLCRDRFVVVPLFQRYVYKNFIFDTVEDYYDLLAEQTLGRCVVENLIQPAKRSTRESTLVSWMIQAENAGKKLLANKIFKSINEK